LTIFLIDEIISITLCPNIGTGRREILTHLLLNWKNANSVIYEQEIKTRENEEPKDNKGMLVFLLLIRMRAW
jgi:hypothetical protein